MNWKNIKKELFSYLKIFICTWLSVLVVVNFLVRPVIVEGDSMYPTLKDQDLGVSNIIGLRISKVLRFDIVVIKLPQKSDYYIVKRVIGLPGETIEYYNEQLFVDGEKMSEPFIKREYFEEYVSASQQLFTEDFIVTLADDEYFCMGDNRPHSSDSRVFGPFQVSAFSSKGVWVFYPF